MPKKLDHAAELSSIDFDSLIASPLLAVVKAQTKAAMTTVDFIQQVGFDDQGKLRTVNFDYNKVLTNPPAIDADTGTAVGTELVTKEEHQLEVPFLTMVPIPFLRVDEMDIDFNAKINSMSYEKTSSKFGIDAELKAKAGWGWGSASLKVNTSYQKSKESGTTVNRKYSMGIKVRMKQEDMPAGVEKLLGILEDQINSTPKAA